LKKFAMGNLKLFGFQKGIWLDLDPRGSNGLTIERCKDLGNLPDTKVAPVAYQ
jgi:hypothetical protein